MTEEPDSPNEQSGWTISDVGHGALDVAGLIPVIGEAADLTNAAWYAAEGNYLDAGLSLISMIPVVGDLLGKGGKVAHKLGKEAAEKTVQLLKNLDIDRFLKQFADNPQLKHHIEKISEALKKWKDEIGEKFTKAPVDEGVAKCSKSRINEIRNALPASQRKLFDKFLTKIDELPALLPDDKGKAIFYSGMVDGKPAYMRVNEIIKNADGAKVSINETPLGKYLMDSSNNSLLNSLPPEARGAVWSLASQKYAESASGVIEFVGEAKHISSSKDFFSVELPTLLNNPAVAPESKEMLKALQNQVLENEAMTALGKVIQKTSVRIIRTEKESGNE